MKSPRITVAAVLLQLAIASPPAIADSNSSHNVVTKSMWFGERGGRLAISTSFTELIDKRAYDRLDSGFATTIVARIYVYRVGHDLPISVVVASFRVVYDLWDEVYVVRTEGPEGRRTDRYQTRAEALRALTELNEMPTAKLAKIPRGPHHYLAVIVALNPVSKALMAEMKRWMTRPTGTSIDRTASFFGSFVSVFVNPKMSEADRVLRFRSQPFYRPVRGARR